MTASRKNKFEKISPHEALLAFGCLVCLLPQVTSPIALLLGACFALGMGNPLEKKTRVISRIMLAASIIGLGAGMDLAVVAKVGVAGIGYTFVGIAFTLALGARLASVFKSDRESSILISVGTAICGGSAIAAIAPVINAKDESISVALGTVFTLNAIALLLFPWAGHLMELSQHQFGLWAALAIHDTSSVVGASMQYGPDALQTGTTVKLARALWIFPLALGFEYVQSKRRSKEEKGKRKFPMVIIGFILMSALFSAFPALHGLGDVIAACAKRLLVVVLFLIGTNLTKKTLQSAGAKALLLGVSLWAIVAITSLFAILQGIVR